MGNRCVITTEENFRNNGIGIYLHWNGGRDSVEAFLRYCELRGFRSPENDNYGWARLCQVIANFFGGDGLSIGIDTIDHLDCDNGDNGVYLIEGWKIVGREYHRYAEQDAYSLEEMLQAIDEAQPVSQQLGGYLKAEEVPVSELKVGDKIYVSRWKGEVHLLEIKGFGEDVFVNGTNVKGLPYVELYSTGRANPNNYIYDKTVRRV